MKKILITGGCGFIGHHLVEHLIKNTDWQIYIIDKLTYAAEGFDRLRDINCFDDKRVHIFTCDLTREIPLGIAREIGQIDYIVHMAAETHVDRSIIDAEPFVKSNVMGTLHLLNYVKDYQDNLKKMIYFSTDEVFGPAPEGRYYKEWDRYNSTNPYSASKAGGEELCLAFSNTHGIPMLISHTMNVFGERQHYEKYIPMTIRKVLQGEEVTIHADPTCTKPGSRFYIHARNVASAVTFLLNNINSVRDKFNIVGEREVDNLKLAQIIAEILGKELKYKLINFHASRPGHDLRYALCGNKMKELGWKIPVDFEYSLRKTIRWNLKNRRWLGL